MKTVFISLSLQSNLDSNDNTGDDVVDDDDTSTTSNAVTANNKYGSSIKMML